MTETTTTMTTKAWTTAKAWQERFSEKLPVMKSDYKFIVYENLHEAYAMFATGDKMVCFRDEEADGGCTMILFQGMSERKLKKLEDYNTRLKFEHAMCDAFRLVTDML